MPLILAYAVVEGLFVGAASQYFNTVWPGVVAQAVLGTACVFVAMFAGWKFGLIRVTERSRKIFFMAVIGYMLFGLINLVLQFTGVLGGFGFFGMGGIGIALCLIGIALAAYSLAIDFDSITRAVQAGLPEKYSWLHGARPDRHDRLALPGAATATRSDAQLTHRTTRHAQGRCPGISGQRP